ncbi:MAG TPA: CBS domain-containing protein [Syntrophorhabdaceae bacterium]|jgi:CBS domain-containing protein|nr:CBS domain-containing protein [Syntrophorhabdaceae bacterium]MDI9562318.1 CBS domain-containing protein [Pseudomonadota bacterium]OQC47217.1 MAG: Hypoxic response protein 1 [Deltaproteobacteria bacterium ADurb.Bin026]MBV6505613.1 Inosine-5'-monophosphate dehydrogenase [Syntrophorhabdaceae bacterium]HNZ58006.1 CBS domain-containing protein [Syntrophorhabdaceae bacterium]
MKVVELMNKNVVTCHPSETLTVIVNKFELFNIAGMPVVEKGKLAGIICQSDILRKIKEGDKTLNELTVRDAMVENVITAPPVESVFRIANTMVQKQINRIPIVENDVVVGIVTRGDIIKAVAECG